MAFLLLVVVHATLGHLTVPAWNSLITDAVGPHLRGQYFGERARLMALTSFAALGLGSVILQTARSWSLSGLGFVTLFVLAALARSGSAHALGALHEAPAAELSRPLTPLGAFLRKGGSPRFRRFVLYSALIHATTLMAGPYFVVYLLNHLHFSYMEYGAWMAAQVVGQFLSLKAWGRLGDRYGHLRVMRVTGYLVPVLPILYVFGSHWLFVVGVNLLAGVVWSGLSLAMGNYLFDTVAPEEKASAVAITSVVNALGWFSGAMVGGWLVGVLPDSVPFLGGEMALISNLPLLFVLSGCGRFLVGWSLLPLLRESRPVEPTSLDNFIGELPVFRTLRRALWRWRSKLPPPNSPSEA